MKELKFAEGLLDPTISGGKKLTIRKYRPEAHDFVEGEVFKGVFAEGVIILLSAYGNTLIKSLSELIDIEARLSGYRDAADARRGLRDYYPDLEDDDKIAIILYEIAKIDGIPVVGPLPE